MKFSEYRTQATALNAKLNRAEVELQAAQYSNNQQRIDVQAKVVSDIEIQLEKLDSDWSKHGVD